MTLILVRHGESEWNAKGLFCGWVDVDLSKSALHECKHASLLMEDYMRNENGDFKSEINQFDICYTSVLKRSIKTAHYILEFLDQLYIPIKKSWRLNERFYGGLTGRKKIEMVEKYGKKQIQKWRRSYNDPPPPIEIRDKYNPINDNKYYKLNNFNINNDFPLTESLCHVIERIKPLWYEEILPLLKKQLHILLCIHGTSMRAIIALIEKEYQKNSANFNTLSKLEIPNGYPVCYTFDSNGGIIIGNNDEWISKQQQVIKITKIHGRFLGDLDALIVAQNKVKNQIEK
eukprot:205595_1